MESFRSGVGVCVNYDTRCNLTFLFCPTRCIMTHFEGCKGIIKFHGRDVLHDEQSGIVGQ